MSHADEIEAASGPAHYCKECGRLEYADQPHKHPAKSKPQINPSAEEIRKEGQGYKYCSDPRCAFFRQHCECVYLFEQLTAGMPRFGKCLHDNAEAAKEEYPDGDARVWMDAPMGPQAKTEMARDSEIQAGYMSQDKTIYQIQQEEIQGLKAIIAKQAKDLQSWIQRANEYKDIVLKQAEQLKAADVEVQSLRLACKNGQLEHKICHKTLGKIANCVLVETGWWDGSIEAAIEKLKEQLKAKDEYIEDLVRAAQRVN